MQLRIVGAGSITIQVGNLKQPDLIGGGTLLTFPHAEK